MKSKKKELERRAETSDKKLILFDMMIDIAEEEFKILIRKKSLPEQPIDSKSNESKSSTDHALKSDIISLQTPIIDLENIKTSLSSLI